MRLLPLDWAKDRTRRYRGAIDRLPSARVLEFRILGPLEVIGDDGPIPLGGPKQRATLAILLLDANRVVSVDRLADDLYSGAAPVTAVTQVQRQISELRKSIGASAIETRAPGYVIRLTSEQLDLKHFEHRTEEATRALARGDARAAADLFGDALELWRGPPLADLAHEPFAQISIERLEEIRLAALEQRIDAELALGSHARLVGELEELVAAHPLRERFRGQLMIAMYRAGRQPEALDVYRRARETLVEEFGIEPTPALRELERAILAQDPSLDLEHAAPRSIAPGAILVLPSAAAGLAGLLALAEPLAIRARREIIIARLLADASELAVEASALNARRALISVASRVAAFTTQDAVGDLLRLATAHEVELVLLDAPPGIDGELLPDELTAILGRSPADVALVAGSPIDLAGGAGIFVPFGGGEHDWAALELGARLASARGTPLVLAGTRDEPGEGRRDASRLLADASLALQRVVGVETTPLLAEATEEALVAAVEPASIVVAGISPRWRREGIGATRRALVRDARPPVMLVHRGPRPGGLAPQETRTRYSWSIEAR
ncbi:MAG TPA: BTAD domain-containing putative transcriptional regulator [Gaiellaceae bacterium]|nr:BTAD domain-containing putative transcriptional regulator [Gaiellaceae bacterium]